MGTANERYVKGLISYKEYKQELAQEHQDRVEYLREKYAQEIDCVKDLYSKCPSDIEFLEVIEECVDIDDIVREIYCSVCEKCGSEEPSHNEGYD